MKISRIILILFTFLFSIAFLVMAGVCITMKIQYVGQRMGNEAQGFFSAAFMLCFLISIPTILLWIALSRQIRQSKKGLYQK